MFSEFWSDVRYRLRAVFRRRVIELELDDELRFHLEHETEKYVRAGLSRAEAVRRARLAFGGVDRIKDDTRDALGIGATSGIFSVVDRLMLHAGFLERIQTARNGSSNFREEPLLCSLRSLSVHSVGVRIQSLCPT